MSGEPPQILPDTDHLLAIDQATKGAFLTAYTGGDPLVDRPPIPAPDDFHANMKVRMMLERDRSNKLNEVFKSPESGWGDFQKFMDGVFDTYKKQNDSLSIKKPTNEQEFLEQAQQMRTVTVDPNEVANVRQLVVQKLIPALKAVDPRFDFWNDPRTKNYAQWLNRETGPGEAGFMQSGDQPVSMGVVGRSAYVAWQGIEGVGDATTSLIHGAWDLGRKSISAMGGPDIGPSYPTNYITSDDGKLYSNGGKAPSMMDGLVMSWNYAVGKNVQQAAADAGRAQEWEQANRSGFGGIATSVSRLGGELVGMGPAFGAASSLGKATLGALTMNGMKALGALRLTKGLAQSDRALKIIKSMSDGVGQAAGMAAYEATTQGRVEGYGAAYAHGLVMAPILMTLGKLGNKTEWFAKNRVGIPGVASKAVAGAMEGAGFAALETTVPDLLPSAWGFIRDPNQTTWEAYAKNAMAFMLVKMGTGRTTTSPPEEMQIRRGIGRAQFAEKVARGEVTPEEVSGAPVPDEAALRRLGEASIRSREGRTPEERQQALQEVRRLESELDVAEMGKGPAEKVVEENSPPEETGPTIEELRQKVRTAKTPEERTAAMKEIRRLESKQRTGGDVTDLGEGRNLEFRQSESSPGAQEWVIRDAEGDIIGHGYLEPSGNRVSIWNSEVSEAHRGKGLYGRVLKELARRYPGGIESPGGQSEAAKGAWKKAGMELGMELGMAGGERMGPQSLQVPPTRQVEADPGVQQVTARDIYSEMEGRPGSKGFRIPFTSVRVGGSEGDPVKVPMRGGNMGGRRALGIFKFFENLVRTKEGRDLAVAAHEWSHAMHRHVGVGGGGRDFIAGAKAQVKAALAGPDGPALDYEIRETLKDYPGSNKMPMWTKWMETWSEWHARNLLGEVGLDRKLPAISAYMRSWLAAPAQAKLRVQYQRIQDMLYRYNAQGSLGRLRQSRVSAAAPLTETQKATQPGPMRRAVEALNKAMLDDMAGLKSSQEKWLKAVGRNPEDVSILEDPARLFDALHMTAAKTDEHFIHRGIVRPDGTRVPGLQSVMDAVKGRTEAFQDYIVAVRSMSLYGKGKGVQLPVQDYAESIKRLETSNPGFKDQAKNLKLWTDALVDFVAEARNISPEDAQRIKDAYVVYVPFFRAIEGPQQHGGGRGVAEKGTGLARIKGSSYEIQDPFIALQQVSRSMIAKAHQNQVMSALFKLAVGHEVGGMATVVDRTNVPTDHPLRRLLDAIEAKVSLPGDQQQELESVFEALRQADALNPETITTFSQKVIPTGEKSIVAFTPRMTKAEIDSLVANGGNRDLIEASNNKLQWLELDTKVYEALMGIDKMPQLPDSMQPIMQWLQAPRDVVRLFATGIAPGFVAANMLRDAMSAPIFDRQGKFRPLGGFVKLIRGAIEYHKNGKMRDLYEELGVKTSSFWTEGRQRALIGEQVSMWQKAKRTVDRVQDWFSHPENYIRMAEFKDVYESSKAEGKSEQEARMLALEAGREITVNFARAGIVARALNQTIPYFNAGLQGQRKLWGQLIAGGADTKGDVTKARIQRGAMLNGLANITVPAVLLWMLNKDEEWYQDLPSWRKIGYFNAKIGDQIISLPKPFEAGTLFGSFPEIFLDHLMGSNPADLKQAMTSIIGPYLQVGTLIPAFLKPLVEVTVNKNMFTGRPLTPEWIARSNPPQEQSTFYTTETAKIMSRAINGILSPIEIEALMGGYTAGAATNGMQVLDEISGMKKHPGLATPLNPFQRFSRQQEHGQSSYVDQLYDLSVHMDQNEDTLTSEERGLKRRIDSAKRQISVLRKEYRSGSLSQKESEKRSYEIARALVEEHNR